MHGLHTNALRKLDECGNVQITFGRDRRPDVIGLIRHTHMQRITIRITIHCHAAQPQLTTRANDAYRNLAPIDDKHLLKWPARYRGCTHKKTPSSSLDFVHLQLKTGSIEKPIEHGTREQSNSRIMGGCWIALHFPDMESHGSKNIMEGGR